MTVFLRFFIPVTGIVAGIVAGLVVDRIRRSRTSRGLLQRENRTIFVYSGNLQQTPLMEALELLEIGKKEGILHLYIGRRKGYISLGEGKIVDAFYRNYSGKEALFRLLDIHEGDFYFEQKKIRHPYLLFDSLMDITIEWDAYKNQG